MDTFKSEVNQELIFISSDNFFTQFILHIEF